MCLVVVILLIAIVFLAGLIASIGLVVAIIPWLIVGLIVGAIASAITRSPHGALGDILIGLAGSVVGSALFALLLDRHPALFSLSGILAATVGAVFLLLVGKAISGRRT